MNADTRLDFPIDEVPKNGTLFSIQKDIHWVRMPLPMDLNHINLWIIGSKEECTLVDSGMFLEDVKNAWSDLIDKEKLSFKRVIVTELIKLSSVKHKYFSKKSRYISFHYDSDK